VYTVTGSAGTCTAQATSTVTVNTPPIVTASSNGPRCVNQNLNLTSTATGGIGYLWNGPNTYSSTTQNPVITSVTQANAGIYTVTAVDANGCVGSDTANVVINPLPVVSAAGSTVCIGSTIGLSANNGGIVYSWGGPNGFSSSAQNPTIPNATPNMSGSYVVTVTDANGCQSGNVAMVLVNALPPVTVNSGSICKGKSIILKATGALTYTWSPAATLSSSIGGTVTASPLATTTYVVIGTDVSGCMNSATSIVSVNPSPVVTLSPTLTTGCAPVCASMTATSASGGTYSWSFGDGNTATTTGPATNCFNGQGSFTPLVTLTDNNGCVGTATTTVVVFPVPTADFYMDPQPTTILDPHITFTDATSGAIISNWFWSLGDPLGTTATTQNVGFTYPDIGTYQVMLAVSSDHNCVDTTYKLVVITDDFALYVPNAFSPNGDGVNEYFMPTGEGITSFKINIFDKWGNLVYSGNDITKGWDGTFRGKGDILAEDVYVWKIEVKTFKNDTRHFTGTVTLIK
jgi:gliding motility-associated-like protein